MNFPRLATKLFLARFKFPTLLSLAAAGLFFASCQSPRTAQVDLGPVPDVSTFPRLAKLPGKVPPQVWSGLAGVWSQNHARWKNSASNDVGSVVFLGDSITQGWNTLARDFPNLKVSNRGIGGDITSGVLYRLKSDVLILKPAGIVLLIGTNDLGDGAEPEDVAGNIQLILAEIKQYYPRLKVIVCKVMPRSERGPQGYTPVYAAKIQKANALIEAYVKNEPNFSICDTWAIYADAQGNPNPADFNPDHLHLNAAGYVAWKKVLDSVIARQDFPAKKAN